MHSSPSITAALRDDICIDMDVDVSFYNKHNPVYCGMESLRLLLKVEELGLKATSTHLAFTAVVHL